MGIVRDARVIPDLPESVVGKRIIPVARSLDPESANTLADALLSAGCTTVEITVEGDQGINAIRSLAEHPITLGAGTVTSIDQAEMATVAGAEFLVSPNLSSDLMSWATSNEIPYLPGVLSPTEVARAAALGAKTVKLFPASIGGPDLVSALKGPFPEVEFIPTGGITADNAADYLTAGALAVGIGGWLTSQRNPETVVKRAAELFAAIEVV
jgi:2-dehydro-3-deoxyphosphogluconate aldolase/(4S)-4-hydroxy-2-oxoglutarate aldolase